MSGDELEENLEELRAVLKDYPDVYDAFATFLRTIEEEDIPEDLQVALLVYKRPPGEVFRLTLRNMGLADLGTHVAVSTYLASPDGKPSCPEETVDILSKMTVEELLQIANTIDAYRPATCTILHMR